MAGWRKRDDIVLGTTRPPLPFPQFRLDLPAQTHHATIWGRTGSGKSKLLQSVFLQHLARGHGVGMIEPHHDLSFETLSSLVDQRFFETDRFHERLIYLDWGNGDYVPFNILAGSGDPHTVALNALEAMLRVWPELSEAPLFQTLFLSSLLALIACGLPITFLYRLLADASFRAACLSRVNDPLVHQTFASFDKLGRDQPQAAGSTLRRAFLLSFNPLARLTLGQPDNWLDFRRIMDEGKSFIINLGNINDHETRKLLGAMLLVQIEQAALSRTDLTPAHRRPFTLLIDEWPSFAAQDNTIGTILSQTRKFRLRLYLAAQSLTQVSSSRLTGALENCRLTIAFGLGRDSAEVQAKHIGNANPYALKETAATPLQHGQYLSIAEQFEAWTQKLQNLSPRMAYVKLHDHQAVRIKTLHVPDSRASQVELNSVMMAAKQRHQRSKREAESAIATLTSAKAPARRPAYSSLFSYESEPNIENAV